MLCMLFHASYPCSFWPIFRRVNLKTPHLEVSGWKEIIEVMEVFFVKMEVVFFDCWGSVHL